MESTNDDTIQFKLRWLNEDGHETGFLRKKGRFDGETLVLDDVQIPVSIVTHVETRESRVILSAITEDRETVYFAFAVTKISPKDLKSALDIARSKSWAEHHKDKLERKAAAPPFATKSARIVRRR